MAKIFLEFETVKVSVIHNFVKKVFNFKESSIPTTSTMVSNSDELSVINEVEKNDAAIIPSTLAQKVADEKQASTVDDEKSLKRKRIRTRNVTTSSKQQKVSYY